MTIITPGEPSAAPYRRLWVLRSIKGLAYEAPDPNNIAASFADIAGDDAIKLRQLHNILSQLSSVGLAKFERGGPGSYGYEQWGEPITIINLNRKLLDKLILETNKQINRPQESEHKPSKKITPSNKKPSKLSFADRHPIWTDIFKSVTAGLILAAIVGLIPPLRTIFLRDVWHHFIHWF